jgi:hypothetical protein
MRIRHLCGDAAYRAFEADTSPARILAGAAAGSGTIALSNHTSAAALRLRRRPEFNAIQSCL